MIRRSGERAFVNQPVRFSTYPETPDDPAPALGEHTQAVLAEYGYSNDEIAGMQADGAI
jgi:crotonobetainyl-CoA:carnitine CoA-transferase CaiB-like acyl-CoA transferase